MTTAVVTLAHGRHAHLELQHRSLALGLRRPDRYLVVAMDDDDLVPADVGGLTREVVHLSADPRGLPLARARNLAVKTVIAGGADVVVLLDVDCLAGPTLVRGYERAVHDETAVVWSGPVTYLAPPPPTGYDLGRLTELDDPHPARPAPRPGERLRRDDPNLFWSLSFATSAAAWWAGGGFHEGYVGYGGEDTDFGRTLLKRGLALGWVGDARAYHQHHPVSRPPVEHVDDILRNGRLFADRWGAWPMEGWLIELERLGVVRRTSNGWERAATRPR